MGKQDLVTMQQIAGIKLPEDLRLAPTLSTFKTRLKTFVCFSFLLNLKYITLSEFFFKLCLYFLLRNYFYFITLQCIFLLCLCFRLLTLYLFILYDHFSIRSTLSLLCVAFLKKVVHLGRFELIYFTYC